MAASMRTAPFSLQCCSFDDGRTTDSSKVLSHYFNQTMTIIIPGATTIPNDVLECFSEQITYKLHGLPLHKLIEKSYIEAFVKKGAMHMLSVNTRLDTGDCVAVTPNGWLVLHLTKDTYQELGLEAVKQNHIQKQCDMYVVKINLLADYFHPGKKGYDRTLWCLKDRLDLTFDMLITWIPHDEKICSSSVGVYFVDKCQKVERVKLQKSSRIFTSLRCPRIDADQPEGSEVGCHYREIFEWMGAVACDVDLSSGESGPDSYTSTMTCPEPSYNCPRCGVFRISGFLTPQNILTSWKALRKYTASHQGSLPASLTVHGFSDSPVSDKMAPHNFYLSGDNIYSLVLLPENQYWLYTAGVS